MMMIGHYGGMALIRTFAPSNFYEGFFSTTAIGIRILE